MQYKEVIEDKFFFTLGGTYDLQTTFNSTIDNTITNIFPGEGKLLNDSTVIYPSIQIDGSDTINGSC